MKEENIDIAGLGSGEAGHDEYLARAMEVKEAILCLRGILFEERDNPAFFERVFRDDGSGKADWAIDFDGRRVKVIEHNEWCPILSALEDLLY